MSDLAPILNPWIDALAKQAAEDYLRLEAANQSGSSDECTKPVPLPDLDQAA